jgi:hypothetical protein
MALNSTSSLLVSSEAPSSYEDEVTFTVTVSDPISGDPNPNTAPQGNVTFVIDGSPVGTVSVAALTALVSAIQSTTSVATYIAQNPFTAGQNVTITGFFGLFAQFNQTNVPIASVGLNSFTVNGTYTAQTQVSLNGNATSTSASAAQASTTGLSVGLHSALANYLGDATPVTGHTASTSNTVTQQVVAVSVSDVVEIPGFALIGSYSTAGDSSLPPQAQLFAIPSTAAPAESINLLWNTLNVAFVGITGNNGVDYQPGGFNTGFISTSGSGIYVIGNGFTASILLTLQAYDSTQTPIAGLTSAVSITIT